MPNKIETKLLEITEKLFPDIIKHIETDTDFKDSHEATEFYADLGEKLRDLVMGAYHDNFSEAKKTWGLE